MLIELAHFLTTPAPWSHRRLGYVRDTALLLGRSRRCRGAWAPHLQAARAAILASAAACPGRRRAIVLGSGLLDDVPIEELADQFETVVLVDAVHPWPARRRAARLANVCRVTAELSGAGAILAGRSRDLVDPVSALGPLLAQGPADLVISANLLSQLPILPLDRLDGRAPDELGARIVRAHLRLLPRLARRACLICDVEAIETDRAGTVHDRYPLLHGVDPGVPDRSWEWDLVPLGEGRGGRRTMHRVVAFLDWGPPQTP